MPDLTQRVRALACNAVAPALDAYNAAHPTRTAPWWLPLSAREVVGTAVAEAVDAEIRREVAAEVEQIRGLLHEAIHGGYGDCENPNVGLDGEDTPCGSCLGCRVTGAVGHHD